MISTTTIKIIRITHSITNLSHWPGRTQETYD
jgi:hypothetical protein